MLTADYSGVYVSRTRLTFLRFADKEELDNSVFLMPFLSSHSENHRCKLRWWVHHSSWINSTAFIIIEKSWGIVLNEKKIN